VLGSWLSTMKLVEIAFSCSAMYGIMPVTAITVTTPASNALLPYREPMKSAIEVMRWCLLMRMIFRSTIHHNGAASVGPR